MGGSWINAAEKFRKVVPDRHSCRVGNKEENT